MIIKYIENKQQKNNRKQNKQNKNKLKQETPKK